MKSRFLITNQKAQNEIILPAGSTLLLPPEALIQEIIAWDGKEEA